MLRKTNQYYPTTTLDPISAQNQPYPSPNYYPYVSPTNTYGLNPSTLKSLKTLDINDLQDVFGKGLQDQNSLVIGEKLEKERIFKEDNDITEIKNSIQRAKLNKILAKQMYQNQMKRIQNIINDTRTDEQVLKDQNLEKDKQNEKKKKKRKERLKNKYLLQQQMKDREILRQESKKEYEKDKQDIENLINNIKREDQLAKEELERKRNIARTYMENSYARKAEQKRKEKEDELLEKEKERKHQEELQKREDEFKGQKAKIQQQKDLIFNQLCEQEAKRQAEKDYWENVRNELYLEQGNKKLKMEEKAEKEKKERQKEEMMASALLHKKVKEENKLKEIEQEKQRLIKENEDLLKGYYPLGYQKALNSLKKDVNDNKDYNTINNDTKHDIIYNNIFGNSNPNRPSAYLNYGKIKNYVYDKSIQEVNHKINVTNYPMYNATANNNYDSYPTPEEYLKLMKQTGQKNFSYAGNTDTTGIPMRSQMPVYVNKALTRSISTGNGIQNNKNNYLDIRGRRNLIKSNSNIYDEKMPQINNYRIQKVNDVGIDKNANINNNVVTNKYGNRVEEKVPEAA